MRKAFVAPWVAVGAALLMLTVLWAHATPVVAGPGAQATLTPRPTLTPVSAQVAAVSSASHAPRLQGAVLNWGKGNVPAGVKVILRGTDWEIPVRTDESGEYRFEDIGNEVAFLSAVAPDAGNELQALTAELPIRTRVDEHLIVNMAFHAKGEAPEPLVAIEMDVSATEASPGDEVSFTIQVDNHWGKGINQVIVADYLPPGLRYLRATSSQGKVIWDRGLLWVPMGYLPADSSATVNVVARVAPDAEPGSTIANQASAYYSENVAVQAESSFDVTSRAAGILPVTGLRPSSLLSVVGLLLIILGSAIWEARRGRS
jgi:uncharacterized repeat protein (TIGR01451 family)